MGLNLPPWVFSTWRLAQGIWALSLLLSLWPYRLEMYGDQGFPVLEHAWWIVVPSPLFLSDAPWMVSAWLGLGLVCAALFTLGVWRRLAAVSLWVVLVCLVARNPVVFDLSWNYVGWSLLASALVPLGEPRWPWQRAQEGWQMPRELHAGACAVLALSYTVSGLSKLSRPEWWSGDAVALLLGCGVARQGTEALLGLPEGVLQGMSYFVLGAELLSAPLSLSRRGRFLAWSAMLLVHLGILATVRLGSLSAGMLIFHLLAVDGRWFGVMGRAGKMPRPVLRIKGC